MIEEFLEDLLKEVKELNKEIKEEEKKEKVEIKSGRKSKITRTEKEKKEYFDSQREEIKKHASEVIDSCETCFIAVGDCGMSGNGTPVDILALLFSAIMDQIDRNDIPEDVIKRCCEEVLDYYNE